MNRLRDQRYAEAIDAALDRIPERIRHRVERVDFLCGVDPIFAGLHKYDDASFVRSYRRTPHVAYDFHQVGPSGNRRTTVVLPGAVRVRTVVHELGHVLHESVDFDHHADPVTEYAKTSDWEAFAEAFTAWILPGCVDLPDYLGPPSGESRAFFEELAA
jgi:hypothetical protein